MNPFVLLWRAGRDVFDELFLMMGVNLIWLLLCAPLFVVAGFLLNAGAPLYAVLACAVNILIFGPATAGLFTVAERVADARAASIGLFFEGMRKFRRDSWIVYGIWIAGMLVLVLNLWFYPQISLAIGPFITILFLYLTLIWLALLIYLGPLLVLQPDRRIRVLWRNAAVMAFGRPVFTLITGILMAIIMVVSVWIFILALLLTFSFLAVWGMRAAMAIIKQSEARRAAQREAGGEAPPDDRGPRGQVRPRDRGDS
jgi:uncharacterized membrane protein YesL